MIDFAFGLSAVLFFGAAVAVIDLTTGLRRMRRLGDLPLLPVDDAPRVSIVVAARNEAEKIETAVRSLLRQDYRPLEIVAVNDRSDDATGDILDRLSEGEPRLRVVHIESLPDGWLGKNHALQRGAAEATGEWLIFTDGDVIMRSTVVRRAVVHALRQGLDHLAIGPDVITRSLWLRSVIGAFFILLSLHCRPWDAPNRRRRAHMGVGAFNMVRASVFRELGGMTRIALRPDDDLKLGKIVKTGGYRQEVVLGLDRLRVEWYPSVRAMAQGLEKNVYAGCEYSLVRAVVSIVAVLLVFCWPWIAVFLTEGPTRVLYAMTCLAWWAGAVDVARRYDRSPWPSLLLPGAMAVVAAIMARSVALTLRRGGIEWRGTRYPLSQLRANKV